MPRCDATVPEMKAFPSTIRLVAFGASLALILSCTRRNSDSEPSSVEIIDVSPSTAADLIARGEVRVLDVRTPEEFALGHIEGAINQNVNGAGFASALEALPHDKPFIVHCAAGSPGGRSRRATATLQSAGAEKVYHSNGGFIGWSREGNPTVANQSAD